MKKASIPLIVFSLLLSLVACNGNDTPDNNNEGVNSTDDTHVHNFSDEYTTDENSHWFACTDQTCNAKDGFSNHDWKSLAVLAKPTSDAEGSEKYICRDCKCTEVRVIAKLPDRMPREQWEALFDFDNVKISIMTGETNSGYEINGDIVKVTTNGNTVYYTDISSVMTELGFAAYYEAFSNKGDGIYICDTLTVNPENLGIQFDYSDITVKINDGKISEINLTAAFGTSSVKAKYSFYDWGNAEVILPTLTSDNLSAATDVENFLNVTMQVQTFNSANNESTWLIKRYDDNLYRISDCINTEVDDEYGECENAVVVTNAQLFELLSVITAEEFSFDMQTNRFVCEGGIELSDGTVFDSVSLILENGKIQAISIRYAGSQIHYNFSSYGTTTVNEN